MSLKQTTRIMLGDGDIGMQATYTELRFHKLSDRTDKYNFTDDEVQEQDVLVIRFENKESIQKMELLLSIIKKRFYDEIDLQAARRAGR